MNDIPDRPTDDAAGGTEADDAAGGTEPHDAAGGTDPHGAAGGAEPHDAGRDARGDPRSGSFVDAARIEAALRERLSPETLEVIDDSHLHAGHAGAREGRHYTVRIRAAAFAGRPRVARHRLVYDALQTWMQHGIHALAIDARAPGEP